MKRLIILPLLFVALMTNAQMIRAEKSDPGGKYLEFKPKTMTPKGVVLCLMGTGQIGTDLTLLDKIEPGKQFKAGLEVPYIVIIPLLSPRSNNIILWLPNDYNPHIQICKSYNLPMHVNGISLGAMALPGLISLPENKGLFKTVASIAGLVNDIHWPTASVQSELDLCLPEFMKISSKFYYGTADNTISQGNGYLSMLNLSNKLIAAKADNTWMPYPGRHHDIWPDAYSDYWVWLNSKVDQPAPAAAPKSLPVPVVRIDYDSTSNQLIFTTQNGKTLILK